MSKNFTQIVESKSNIIRGMIIDSAKYRASRLIERLEECEILAVIIRDDEKNEPRDRLETGKTACEAGANIYKLINEGPTFRVSLPTNPHTINVEPKKIDA